MKQCVADVRTGWYGDIHLGGSKGAVDCEVLCSTAHREMNTRIANGDVLGNLSGAADGSPTTIFNLHERAHVVPHFALATLEQRRQLDMTLTALPLLASAEIDNGPPDLADISASRDDPTVSGVDVEQQIEGAVEVLDLELPSVSLDLEGDPRSIVARDGK
eukprot:SAG11_NODE_7004_length_1210_cov_0.959496_1_plen_161_part_00